MVKRLGERVKASRKRHKLTQAEFGAIVGFHPPEITKFEKAETVPTLWSLARLAWLMDCEAADLISSRPFPE